MKPASSSGIKLVLWWIFAYPAVSCIVSLALAGPVAAAEGASFGDAFLFLLMLMTLTGIPLTAWAPTGGVGIVITLLLAIPQLFILCVFIGVSAGPLLDPFVDILGLSPKRAGANARKQLLVYCLGFPLLCIVFSLVFGGILAAAEEWPYMDGFVLALGEVTNTKVALPSTPPPLTAAGKVIGLILGILSIAILGTFIAVGSVPLLGFDLTFGESPVLRKLPWLLNAEQREGLSADRKPTKTSQIAPRPGGSSGVDMATKVEPFTVDA